MRARKPWYERIRVTLSLDEIRAIRRSLCLTSSVVKNLSLNFVDRETVEKLLDRFDNLASKIIAGLKTSKRYHIPEEEVANWIKSWKEHRRILENHADDISKLIDVVWLWGKKVVEEE